MEYIDATIYINLEHRKDRKAQIEQECKRMDIKATRFNAILHEHGLIGCLQSHLAVLEIAKKNQYKNILILEDDFQFIVSKGDFESEIRVVFESKIPYDVLMLGFNLLKFVPFTPNLVKVLSGQTASAYIVHESMYDVLIKCYKTALPMLISTKIWDLYANDQVWKTLQPQGKWYAFRKRIGIQRESFSDTTGKVEYYGI